MSAGQIFFYYSVVSRYRIRFMRVSALSYGQYSHIIQYAIYLDRSRDVFVYVESPYVWGIFDRVGREFCFFTLGASGEREPFCSANDCVFMAFRDRIFGSQDFHRYRDVVSALRVVITWSEATGSQGIYVKSRRMI